MSRNWIPPRGPMPNSGDENQHCAVCNVRLNSKPREDRALCVGCNKDAAAYQERPFLLYGQFPRLENYLRKQRRNGP